ncbi:autotransporter domain-containing protein [Pseudaminobacter soli (ex Li et al. 2025)]|uniref:autotransporter domain-containing protein n=1 Tax=Pseudaminobacter soli (ex Li et al. 2025) TaxID=1295366 RepID=UPI00247305DB|nr:autotransporter domain-containing protein [Mesorhizobium soli]
MNRPFEASRRQAAHGVLDASVSADALTVALSVPAAARHCRASYFSTALAAIFWASGGFQPAQAQTVTINGDVDPAGATSPIWNAGALLYVGEFGAGTLTIADGGKVTNAYGKIGVNARSTGTVTVSSTDAIGNASTWANSDSLSVGEFGTGTLTIEGGGKVTNTTGYIGAYGSSTGTVTVSGADSAGNASTWTNSGLLSVGNSGTGTLAIADGGKVTNTIGYIGNGSRSTGTVTVSGTDAGGNASTWTNLDNLLVGGTGTGTLTVAGGGRVTNAYGYIGAFSGSTGTVTVSGADSGGNASTWTNSGLLSVGNSGTGTLAIEAGGRVTNTIGYIGNGSNSTGTVTVSGTDASGNASSWANSGELFVGVFGIGTLTVADGGKVSNSTGNIGYERGSTGTVTVSGTDASGNASTWVNSDYLSVGSAGTGTLTIVDGGKVSNTNGYIGDASGSTGTVTVSGADASGNGSTWTNSGILAVGASGTGTLTIADGGRVTNTSGYIGFGSNSTNTVTVTGTDASGNASTWANSANLYVGFVGTGTLTIADGGIVSADFVGARLGWKAAANGTINIGAAAGDAAVAAGTLEATMVQFGDGAGTIVFNHSGATTFAAPLLSNGTGTHAVEHYAGTTTLTGLSSFFSGTTTVSGGSLIVGLNGMGALGGSLTVGAGGLLGGTGNLGSTGSIVTIAAGAVHAPGNSIGVQHVLGDYVNHGTLRIEATPSEADRIVVAGSVDITGATLDLVLSPTAAASLNVFNGPFTILEKQSAGVIVGTFGPVTQNLLFLDALLDYAGGDGNDVTLELRRNDLAFASVGRTRNQSATGGAIGTLDNSHAVWRSIALTAFPDTVRRSFDALSGEIHASAKSALIEDSRFVRNAIDERLRAAFAAPGTSHAPVLAYGPGDTPVAVAPDHAGPVVWSYGFGSWGSIDSDDNAASLERSTGGLLIGTDGLVGDWRVGLLAGYSHSRFDVNDRFSSGSSDNYHLGLYGGTEWGNLAFRSGLAYTWNDLSTRRTVAIPGIAESLAVGYHAGTLQAFGEVGYGIEAGPARFEPFANLAHVRLHTNGFTENGGVAALSGCSDTTDTTFTTLGLRAEHKLGFGTVDATLRGVLGWRHAFGDTTPTATQAFSAGDAFTIAGVPIAKDSAVIEAGLDLKLTPEASFGLSYIGQFASGARENGFKANLAVRF